jgi:hypothetical protein
VHTNGRHVVFNIDQPEIFWLVVTNLLLGALVLACLAVLCFVVAKECGVHIRLRARKKRLLTGLRSLSRFGVDTDDESDRPDERELHPGKIPEKHADGKPG